MSLKGKMIVLGVTGGIAAYKAATICSQLSQKGADIRVIMTESATKFVQPLTFQTLSRNRVYVDTFDEQDASVVSHIDLADHADLFLIAPATANIIGKLAHGLADDMLSTTLLATEAPVWIAPAMNGHMYEHPSVQQNISRLKEIGVTMIEPDEGQLACGYVGKGRLAEPEDVIRHVQQYFEQRTSDPAGRKANNEITSGTHDSACSWWKGKKLLVTAGPTREEIDPVRYLTNYSSGKMGYALAEQGVKLGAEVTLVSGPVALQPPAGVHFIHVSSTDDMYHAVMERYEKTDVVIKSAAVADYQPVEVAPQKMKKNEDTLTLQLKKTKDILQALGEQKKRQILVGFAAETNDIEHYAQKKLKNKNLDFVVLNDVTQEGVGFGTETNEVTLYHRSGWESKLPLMDKQLIAKKILQAVADQHGS